MKFNHQLDRTQEMEDIRLKVVSYIRKAEYKKAYKYLQKISPKYPKSYYIASMLATLNVEDSFVLSDKEMQRDFDKAAKKLRVLLYSIRGASPRLRGRNINEYYWFSQQHKKQYDLGMKEIANKNLGGNYPAGVGAANHAYKLKLKGQLARSKKWAAISEKCWKTFFDKVDANYHDAWFWYALSLGLQGKTEESEKAMIHSAKLGKLNVKTYPAFKKLRRMLG